MPAPKTSKDIARAANVSQTTVSRVLSDHPGVHPETRQRVLAVIRDSNYRPNGMARAMRTSRNGNIGVVVSRLSNPIYAQMLQLLAARLRKDSLRMVVWNSDDADAAAAASAVGESLVDGVIMMTASAALRPIYDAMMVNAPVVLVHRLMDGWPCDQVGSDNRAGAALVAEYLVRAGRRRIGLVAAGIQASTISDRLSGFHTTLEALGCSVSSASSIDVEYASHKIGMEAADYLLDLAQPPDAIFCVNDVLALGVCDAARRRGIRVPQDLWIVGYDDIEMSSWPAFDLTTVRQPLSLMVEKAVSMLAARIQGAGHVHEVITFPNDLVVRGSTGACRVSTAQPAGAA